MKIKNSGRVHTNLWMYSFCITAKTVNHCCTTLFFRATGHLLSFIPSAFFTPRTFTSLTFSPIKPMPIPHPIPHPIPCPSPSHPMPIPSHPIPCPSHLPSHRPSIAGAIRAATRRSARQHRGRARRRRAENAAAASRVATRARCVGCDHDLCCECQCQCQYQCQRCE